MDGVKDGGAASSTAAGRGSGSRKPYNTKRKRQRALLDAVASPAFGDRALLVDRCRGEIRELCAFFRESLVPDLRPAGGDAPLACAVEGSALPLSALAEEIARGREGATLQSLLTELPFVGSRVKYGVEDAADAGETDGEWHCLWCWEAREVSMFPKSQRGLVKFLRATRKKVHARITALSVTMAAISNSENSEDFRAILLKASERLGQESNLDDLRASFERFLQKESKDMAPKECKDNEGPTKAREEKEGNNDQTAEKEKACHEKELNRLKDEADKEARKREKEEIELKRRLKRQQDEVLKEERKREKEEMEMKKRLKREQDEVEKEQKRREKEEMELKKRLKREQDEAEKEQKRREKEEVESKKLLSLKKQATIMEKFLKRKSDNNSGGLCADLSKKVPVFPSVEENVDAVPSVISSMDSMLSHQATHSTEDFRKIHLAAWRNFSHKSRHWGIRNKPKIELVKNIRLQGPSLVSCSQKAELSTKEHPSTLGKVDDPNLRKESDDLEEIICILDGPSEDESVQKNTQKCKRVMKLLQFDKSPRPAYYGTWSKKSTAVGPRHPLNKDSGLDYDIESDEEWEEEEPGESLTDCEKDEEECDDAKGDPKEDSEDSFVVPDGYLSEDEGAEMDVATSNAMKDDASSLPSSQLEIESEEVRLKLQHVKYLNSLTEKALSKSQPLIISNLMHEKSDLSSADLNGLTKLESTCLQALCMQIFAGGSVIEFSPDNALDVEERCQSQCKADASPAVVVSPIPESNLLDIVRSIQSCPQSIGKVVEVLQQKFPAYSKTQIKSKVREIAEFTDNRWKVKKEVLDSLGLPSSPDQCKKSKGITTFFSKRCLPPSGGDVCAADSSPIQKKLRTVTAVAADSERPTNV